MDERFVRSITDRLQRERRALIDELSRREERTEALAGDLQSELEEHAQTEVASGITEALGERQHDRLGNIDEALARIEAGSMVIVKIVAGLSPRKGLRRMRQPLSATTARPKKTRMQQDKQKSQPKKRLRPADHCHPTLS